MKFLKWILFSLFAFCGTQSFSQYYYYNDGYYDKDWLYEFGASVGGMNSITDIGGSKGKGGLYLNDLNLKYTQMSGGFYIGAVFQQLAGVRLEATWGTVRGADNALAGASNISAQNRVNRNLNFFSSINEVTLIGEFHPLALNMFSDHPPALSPYIMAGLGWFSFNPQISLDGKMVDLKPLRTEGQGMQEYKDRQPYHLQQANVPFGLGLKYDISQMFTVRGEILHRFLFTDYLDDLSTDYIDRSLFDKYLSPMQAAQANAVYSLKKFTPPVAGEKRGNPNSKDSYVSFNLKLGVTLGRQRR